MNEVLQLELQSKKYDVENKILDIKRELIANALRYKHKSEDRLYQIAYDATNEFIAKLNVLTKELEVIFEGEVK
jgi:hypothetical protein